MESCHLIYLIDVSKWLPVGAQLHEHQGEFASCLLITAAQNLSELLQVVRLETDLLRVHDDLVKLARLRETLHHLKIRKLTLCIRRRLFSRTRERESREEM